MKFAYQALDKSGREIRAIIEGTDRSEAIEALRRNGLFVTEIGPAGRAAAAGQRVRGTRGISRGKRLKYLAVFSRQLQVLVSTGTPITQALEALERQVSPGPWRIVLTDIRARVEQGELLSEALAHHPVYFDPICRSMVEAGEMGGNFAAMLERMAQLAKKQLHVQNAIVGAMVYPALLVCVSFGVLMVLLTFVLPRFADLFKSLDAPIPPSTKFLMAVSDLLRGYWMVCLAACVGVGVGVTAWMKTSSGKRTKDTVCIRFPQLGSITRNFATARLIRTLGILLQSKIPLLDALRLTRLGMPNFHYSALVDRAEEAVSRGEPVSSAFARGDLIAPSVYEAIRNGERSGQVGAVLINMAEFLDEENEVVMKSLTSILEPMILIVLGIVVGLVALSMFLPLFDLTAMTRGGG